MEPVNLNTFVFSKPAGNRDMTTEERQNKTEMYQINQCNYTSLGLQQSFEILDLNAENTPTEDSEIAKVRKENQILRRENEILRLSESNLKREILEIRKSIAHTTQQLDFERQMSQSELKAQESRMRLEMQKLQNDWLSFQTQLESKYTQLALSCQQLELENRNLKVQHQLKLQEAITHIEQLDQVIEKKNREIDEMTAYITEQEQAAYRFRGKRATRKLFNDRDDALLFGDKNKVEETCEKIKVLDELIKSGHEVD
ncbi:hypothetical protein CRE_31230 [Caenorhabditis remanei]|uniref:Uncharacterized protein n=1 Tax=Caenorhabditis remanei TaxID=31234 RepID=E3MLQ0_CAERE|nr:hypothetical protein CRE_31230 [Caenorhabditis remanei]